MKSCTRSCLLSLLALVTIGRADVSLHPLFTDGAVLQRGRPVPVWGRAAPGETITIAFAGQRVAATADSAGRWRVTLAPLAASAEPRELVAQAANTVTVHDVLVGDVWLASGQSNMASPMSSGSAANALPEATDPLLRFYTVAKAVASAPLTAPQGKWEASSPLAAKNFSAVAYFFAREIRRTQDVPVAVINASWGGTPIRTWMSLESLRASPPIVRTLEEWESALAQHLAVKDKPELMAAYYQDMKDWETKVDPSYRAARKAHDAEVALARAAGKAIPPSPKPDRPEPQAPDPIALPSATKRPATPTITYNAMIAPLTPFALRGVLWYQGEADAARGAEYRTWFPRLIEGWRTAWAQSDLPFVFVQLPANGRDDEPVAAQGLPNTREAQALALRVPATAMAVTLEIGNPADVHPDNKVHVGHRLALAARALVYGEKVVGSGPLYRSHTIEGGAVRVRFEHTDDGLVVGEAPWRPLKAAPLPTDRLVGFYVCGTDRKWTEAGARIEGDSVIVSAPAVPAPIAARYGWALSPRVNLYNRAGLPAAPFRTDDWP